MQFFTAIAAYVGTVVGLTARRNKNLEKYMLAATAGGFVYLAATNILPPITQSPDSLLQVAAELVAFLTGVGFMVAVAFLE